MDIQKEREAFEAWLKSLNENGRTTYFLGQESTVAWEAWQAAKAQAVPEGFVLINASDRNQEMLELIDQRDYMESQAEELKDKLQTLYGVDFGEHSSCNFPFQNAIDYDDSDLVLVPREMQWHKADDLACLEWGRHVGLFCSENRDMSALQVEEFRLRWCKNKANKIMSDYKAMIEAQEQAND